jgi:hypothetical protein
MKSEESLQLKLNQLQALVDQQQRTLSEREYEIKQLRLEVLNGQEQVAKVHRSWEAKSEALLSQQLEKYKDLNDRYLQVLTRARSCESKLEELFVDPLSLQPFEMSSTQRSEAETGLNQQLSILDLIEEHQRKEDSLIERNQLHTEQLLAQTLKEIGKSHEIDVSDLLASIRTSLPAHTEEELKKIELSVPNLFIETRSSHQQQETDDETENLDWSIATTDDVPEDSMSPSSENQSMPHFEIDSLNPLESVPWRTETPRSQNEEEEGFESGADDSFFNESFHESS